MTLLALFGILFLVNLLTVGGGYVALPLLHRFFVDDLGWLTQQDFLDAIAVGQVTPGPLTLMNAFIGYKVAGVPGAFAAALGSFLPSVLVVSFVSRFWGRVAGSRVVASAFRGVTPALVGMLLAVGVDLAATSLGAPLPAAIALGAFAALGFTRLDPTWIVLGAGVMGAALL